MLFRLLVIRARVEHRSGEQNDAAPSTPEPVWAHDIMLCPAAGDLGEHVLRDRAKADVLEHLSLHPDYWIPRTGLEDFFSAYPIGK